MAASLSSRKLPRPPLFQRWSIVSHVSRLGIRIVRTTMPAATMSASGVDEAVESCRLDSEYIGHRDDGPSRHTCPPTVDLSVSTQPANSASEQGHNLKEVSIPLRYVSLLHVVKRTPNAASKTVQWFVSVRAPFGDAGCEASRRMQHLKSSHAGPYNMFIITELAALCNVPLVIVSSSSLSAADSPPLPSLDSSLVLASFLAAGLCCGGAS